MARKLRGIIIPLCLCIGEAISEILCPVWCSLVKREIEKLEIALQRTTKVIRGLKHMVWKERFRQLGLFGLEKRRLRRK